jgi:hypothetical protein
LGDTRLRAIVCAMCSADPAKVSGGGTVESVLTCLIHFLLLRAFAILVPLPSTPDALIKRASPAAFEKLYGSLVSLCRSTGFERSEILAFPGSRIGLSRIQPVPAGPQLANHTSAPPFAVRAP